MVFCWFFPYGGAFKREWGGGCEMGLRSRHGIPKQGAGGLFRMLRDPEVFPVLRQFLFSHKKIVDPTDECHLKFSQFRKACREGLSRMFFSLWSTRPRKQCNSIYSYLGDRTVGKHWLKTFNLIVSEFRESLLCHTHIMGYFVDERDFDLFLQFFECPTHSLKRFLKKIDHIRKQRG